MLRRNRTLAVFITLGGVLAAAPLTIATANYDNSRSNANLSETVLTQAAVAGGGFGKLGAFAVDGQVFAQPLYVSGLQIPSLGSRNVLFVATMNDSVYAFDADAPGATAPLWQVSLGTAVPSGAMPSLNDLSFQVGILSTPVIDADRGILYVVGETFEAGAPVFRLHGLSITTGQESQNGPVVLEASVAGSASDAVEGVVQFDPYWHLQRPGLTLANGAVYVAFASHGDFGNYHGWVMAYSASNLQVQTALFNATPNGNGGGIWQSGRGLAVDGSGNIYVVTGNGDFDGNSNFAGAVIKLSGADLSVLDWYTPAAWAYLDANDLDVGSTGALVPSGTDLVLTGDKGGRLIHLSSSSLGHVESAPGTDGFRASTSGIFNLALWQTGQSALLYEQDLNGFLKSYSVTASGIDPAPVSTGTWSGDSLYEGLAVSSNGSTDGIVWETTGDHSKPGIPATLHAWNATDLTQELWNSNLNPADVLGSFAKFAVPLVANGQVYVPALSNQVVVYGLQTTPPNQAIPQIAAVLNGGSLVATAVSPGELVSILGSNLGPAGGVNFQLNQAGQVPASLGGIQVTFDGIAAPILYSSANRITLVVPFEVNGPVAQILVENQAGVSAAATLPVSASAPSVITASGLGNGQVAALNQDGSPNSAANPAALESIVSIYVTGLGQMTPQGADGAVAGATLPSPNLPVSVQVGGWPAYVVYAGAAPGTVEGVFQINFRIPPLAPTGSYESIIVQAGDGLSQTDTWIAIGD